jgi:hypothetical protein
LKQPLICASQPTTERWVFLMIYLEVTLEIWKKKLRFFS